MLSYINLRANNYYGFYSYFERLESIILHPCKFTFFLLNLNLSYLSYLGLKY